MCFFETEEALLIDATREHHKTAMSPDSASLGTIQLVSGVLFETAQGVTDNQEEAHVQYELLLISQLVRRL